MQIKSHFPRIIQERKKRKKEKKENKKYYSEEGKKLNTDLYCDNCRYHEHTRSNCYHIIGFPENKEKIVREEKRKISIK